MSSDVALRGQKIISPEHDVKAMINRLYPMDQTIVLNTLQDMSLEDMNDSENLWKLTKAALAAVRNLQRDLNASRADAIAKSNRIHNLEQLVTTDELTKLTNRRGFFDHFEKEIDRTNRGQNNGGVLILIDMDNFKSINDTYGHDAGDMALKMVAQTLQAHIRKMDQAARLGGDEFIVSFANADAVASVDRVQKLARKLNSLTLKYEGYRIPVRASLGIQAYKKGDSVDSIFKNADTNMYAAKKERKNQERK